MADQLSQLVERLERVATRLERTAGSSSSGAMDASDEGVPIWLEEFDTLLSETVQHFVTQSSLIGGLVNEQAQLLMKAFTAQRVFLAVASKSKKPPQSDLPELLSATSEQLNAIMEIKEKNRSSPLFNYLAAVAESVSALAWVTMEPTPAPYVKDMSEAGIFYVNRVLKEFKEKEPASVEWTKALKSIWANLHQYVKANHTTGVTWNPKGGDAKAAGAGAPTPPAAGAAPPPPPPGGIPPPPPSGGPAPAPSKEVDTSALFAELNKGGDITKGLKKVDDSMKTHKNPTLRKGPAPFKPSVAPKPVKSAGPPPASAAKTPVAKPPLVELQGKKWAVEYLTDSTSTCIDDTENKQTVYIYKCTNSTVQVKGKINSITLDNCKKTAVVFDDVISVIEFVNCQSCKAQVLGKVPTVGIEKTDGCQIFLSKDSLDTSFISAKSSEMNVVVPTSDGDFSEFAIAEQFRTTFNGKTLVTEVNDIAA